MASSELGSAIDDSFEATSSPPAYQAGASDRASEIGYYNGPRSGHWTVASSIGSAIDDGCPTVWGAESYHRRQDLAASRQIPITGVLLRKLANAAVQQKIAAVPLIEDLPGAATEQQPNQHYVVKRQEQQAAPKGFYIPRTEKGRGIKVHTKQGKDVVIAAPTAKVEKVVEKKADVKSIQVARRPSPQPSVRKGKAASIRSKTSVKEPRLAVIKAKDGREAVVQLPQLPPQISQPPPKAYSPPSKESVPLQSKPNGAPKAKKAMREQYDEDKTAAAKMAAQMMVSGGIPLPSNARASPKQRIQTAALDKSLPQHNTPQKAYVESVKSSAKDSALGFGGTFEEARAAQSLHSARSASHRSLREAVMQIGMNSKQATPINQAKSASSAASARNSGRQSPTVFAGKGWISPHPLSGAPSEVESQINVQKAPFEPVATMTYNEWKSIQQSKSSQKAESRAGSGVSRRAISVAASIANSRVASRSAQGQEGDMGSKHSSRRSVHDSAEVDDNGWGALPGF